MTKKNYQLKENKKSKKKFNGIYRLQSKNKVRNQLMKLKSKKSGEV